MTSSKEKNKSLVTNSKAKDIYKLSDKEFRKKLKDHQL
jgi:hypothetical protein